MRFIVTGIWQYDQNNLVRADYSTVDLSHDEFKLLVEGMRYVISDYLNGQTEKEKELLRKLEAFFPEMKLGAEAAPFSLE